MSFVQASPLANMLSRKAVQRARENTHIEEVSLLPFLPPDICDVPKILYTSARPLWSDHDVSGCDSLRRISGT